MRQLKRRNLVIVLIIESLIVTVREIPKISHLARFAFLYKYMLTVFNWNYSFRFWFQIKHQRHFIMKKLQSWILAILYLSVTTSAQVFFYEYIYFPFTYCILIVVRNLHYGKYMSDLKLLTPYLMTDSRLLFYSQTIRYCV